jgi:hypothetical protein
MTWREPKVRHWARIAHLVTRMMIQTNSPQQTANESVDYSIWNRVVGVRFALAFWQERRTRGRNGST